MTALDKNEEVFDSSSAMQSKCIVCLRTNYGVTDWWSRFDCTNNDRCLDKHLSSIFLLKNVFQLSTAQCVEILGKGYGADPGNWFVLCESCSELLKMGVNIHIQVCELEKKLNRIREDFKAKMKLSLKLSKSVESDKRKSPNVIEIHTIIRDCFKESHGERDNSTSNAEFDQDSCSFEENPNSEDEQPHSGIISLLHPESTPKQRIKLHSHPHTKGSSRVSRRTHLKRKVHRQPVNKPCNICYRKYTTISGLYFHKRLHNLYPITCEICKYPLKNDIALANHHRRKHSSDSSQQDLNQKLPQEHPDNLEDAEVEGLTRKTIKPSGNIMVQSTSDDLDKHCHKNEDKLNTTKCIRCEYKGRSHVSLKTHMRQHKMIDNLTTIDKDEDKFRCNLCSETGSKSNLFSHMKNTHAEEIGLDVFSCHICGKLFTKLNNLEWHISSIHEKLHRYVCTICGKGYDIKNRFESHMDMHKNEEKSTIVCDLCGLCFTVQSSLRNHLRKFHSQQEMKKTGNTNVIEKSSSLQCKHCYIQVIHIKALKLHLKTAHQHLFQFKCDLCSASYMHSSGLETHKKAKHSGKKWSCPYCQSEVTCEAYLKSHWLKYCKFYPRPGSKPEKR